MIDVRTVRLPTHFEKDGEIEKDSRFQKVKIYIAHTGENLNNSVFSHDVLESMIPSLAHIPILGYIGVNEDEESDFRGHEKKLSIDESGFKVRFNTHAYGFVPSDNNAHFEVTGGKEWLVTDGYLWTRFIDAMEIFDDANGTKGQSMEVGNVNGYTDERGRMVFTEATFTGLCILGDDVPPAMKGSTVSMVFSEKDFKTTFEQMLAEFTAEKGEGALATKKKQKDESTVIDTVKDTPEKKDEAKTEKEKPVVNQTKANPESAKSDDSKGSKTDSANESKDTDKVASPTDADKGEDKAEPSNDDHETSEETEMSQKKSEKDLEKYECANKKEDKDKDKKSFKKDDQDEDVDPEDETDEPEDDEKKKAQFELSLSERERAFLEAVRSQYGSSFDWIMLETVYDEYGIVRATKDDFGKAQYFRIDYSVNADDSINVSNKVEVFPMFVTEQEKNKIESDRVKLSNLEEQIKKLTDYKNEIEMQAKRDALDNASDNLTSQQIKDIKSQFEAKSPEEIEKEIAYAIYTTYKNEAAPSRGRGVVATDFEDKHDYGYGSANELFHK